MPEMEAVFSSHVDQIGYDEDSQELHVVFSKGKNAGQPVVYQGVLPEVAEQVRSAPSIGSALHALVRSPKGAPVRYPHG